MSAGKSKTIMILGGGVMQLPAVRLAKERGWRVIVAAREVSKDIAVLADAVESVDLKDEEAMLATARRYCTQSGLDGVFTAGTDFSTTVAYVAAGCGLPGLPVNVAKAASDKKLMRDCLQRHGVPIPRYFSLKAGETPSGHGLDFPLVVKPVDNMGARGVRRVDSQEELERALEQASSQSRTQRVIVEEYLEGPELSLDAIVFEGGVTICGVADRHICFPPFFVEMGHTMPTLIDSKSRQVAEETFRQGIRALGITNGAAKGDIKLTPKGCFVGEIAARLSGGYMSGWTFPYAAGLEVTAAAMNIAVGLPPGELTHDYNHVSAERAFISLPGRVSRVEGLENARGLTGIEALFLRTGAGETVHFPIDNMGKCGNIISRAENREQAVSTAERAVQSVLVRLQPDQALTTEHLFAPERRETSPPALVLQEEADRLELKKMPPYILPGGSWTADGGAAEIAVLDLPRRRKEKGTDWHGLGFEAALEKALGAAGFSLQEKAKDSQLLLGSLFWRAFLNGSVQGVVYLGDTLRNGGDIRSALRRLAV
jgi:biotin carboxylase